MITFKVIRKIGKMLRGGAGDRQIFLGALMGVLIGFNPVMGLTLWIAILITLLLNANIGFTLLGVALGKVLSLVLSAVSFHVGFFIIHRMGLEGLFTALANAPGTALMDLDVYAMVGSLPFSLIIGFAFGKFMAVTVTKIREQMVRAGEIEKVSKTVGHKISKFLLWLAFGKQKVSTADVLAKKSPPFRKSGIIFVAVVLVTGLLLEFLLLDKFLKSSIQNSISAKTGAEVNIEKARFSIGGGKLEIINLEVTDPEKPTHNLVQIDQLTADLSMSDLLRRTYTIDLLAGSTLKRDTARKSPGKVYEKAEKKKPEPADAEKEKAPGKSLEDYFAKAGEWKKYGEKIQKYLEKRKQSAEEKTGKPETAEKAEKPVKAVKEEAVIDAKKLGYLKARADLVADRPDFLIHRIEIANVEIGGNFPLQKFEGTEVCSHPELNGQPTVLVLTPHDSAEPTAKIELRFDDPAAPHKLLANAKNISLSGVETSDKFPVNMNEGKVDIKTDGSFSADKLNLPFTLLVHNLKAEVEEGKKVLGMDAKTAAEVLSSMETIELDGSLTGTLKSPDIDYDKEKLMGNMKEALVAAGKKELSERADKEMDKAKDKLKEKGGEELNKALGGKEGESTEEKTKGLLKKIF